jgi:hypothetical protein
VEPVNIDDKLYDLMTHAEDLQKAANAQFAAVNAAIERLEGKSGEAMVASARIGANAIVSETTEAVSGLIEELKELSTAAKETALEAKVSIHNSWVQWIGLLALACVMLSAIAVSAVGGMTSGLRHEAERLRLETENMRNRLTAERETLNKMRSETWGIQLIEQDGSRFILLKPGDRMESHEKDNTAARYVIGEGKNRQEAIKVLP